MTLIEIVVVLAVMSLMVSMVLVGFGAQRSAELNGAVTELANTIRFAFDKARVSDSYYRLTIDLEKGTFALQAADEAMYLPATDRDGKTLVLSESELEDRAERDKRAKEQYFRSVQSQVYREPGDDEDGGGSATPDPYGVQARDVPRRRPPLFESFKDENALSGLGKPIALPEDVKIVYVRTAEDPDPITAGQAAIYFFPQGRTQLAHIQIVDTRSEEESAYTIEIQPLTGRVTIVPEKEDLVLPDDMYDGEDELGKRQNRRTF